MVADGEGATRVGRIEVSGAASSDEAERVARAIANSPLVKTALFGRDPNWGRIAQAAGMALAGEELEELGPDSIEAAELGSEAVEAEIRLRPGRGDGSAHVYFSDLTHGYVGSTRSTRHDLQRRDAARGVALHPASSTGARS